MPLGRSRIDLKTVPARGRSLPPQPFDVLMIVGGFNWGPMNVATVVSDYPDCYTKFGDLLSTYEAQLQLKLFFEGGGRRAVVTRVSHIADHSLSSTPLTAVKASYTLTTASAGYSGQNTLLVEALYYGTLTLKVKVQEASNGSASKFDLLVYRGTEQVEWFRNLSMLDTDDRYVEDIVNTSSEKSVYIRVTDQDVGGVAGLETDQRPEDTASPVTLTGGNDGMDAIDDNDYTGAADFNTGLYAFNLVADGDLLICPDNTNTAFQNTAITYCEETKQGKVLFIPDIPTSTLTKSAVQTHAEALTASESRTGVLWPHVKIANPNKTVFGKAAQLVVAPSGMYTARIAKNSEREETKYFTQPGNEVYGLLDAAVGLETDLVLEPTVRDFVTDYKVNCIVAGTRGIDGNYGVWVDDVLLGKTSDNFVSVGESHGISYLRKIFEIYMQRHRTQNNTPERRRTIQDAFRAELLKWTARGCFASQDASQAFYVNADPNGDSLNNPTVQDAMQLKVLIGVATARPGRFIELLFTRDSRATESYIQQQLTATANA
jgi:hypothetical protein